MSSKFGMVLANNATMKLVAYNILNNKYFFYRAIDFIDLDHYKSSPVVQAFFKLILDYYESTNNIIGINTLLAQANTHFSNKDYYDDLINFINISNELNEIVDVDYLVGMLENLVKNDLAMNEAINVAKVLKDYDDTKMINVAENFEKITSIRFQADEFESFFHKDFDEFYTQMTEGDDRLEFCIKVLNETTDGGVRRGTLNTVIGGTGAGKTLTMLSLFMDYLTQGYNCAYISLELSAVMIRERWNANRLNSDLSDMKNHEFTSITRDDWKSRWDNPFKVIKGKELLKTSEPHSYSAKDIERLIIRFEKVNNCKIDVVFIDHLSLMNTYGSVRDRSQMSLYGQAQAEEAITMAKRLGVAVWTGAQFNRGAMGDKDSDMSGIAGSIGVTHASDFVMSIHVDQETGALLGKKHKSRYSDVSYMDKFLLGIDRAKQRLYDYDSRSMDMSNFDAKFEEVRRANSEKGDEVYIETKQLETWMNADKLDTDAVDKAVREKYDGVITDVSEPIHIPVNNEAKKKSVFKF